MILRLRACSTSTIYRMKNKRVPDFSTCVPGTSTYRPTSVTTGNKTIQIHPKTIQWYSCAEKIAKRRKVQEHLADVGTPMRDNAFIDLLKVVATASSIGDTIYYGNVRFTFHCFRRGGAQHRFMFAPENGRWPLKMVKWWAALSPGERQIRLSSKCNVVIWYNPTCCNMLEFDVIQISSRRRNG